MTPSLSIPLAEMMGPFEGARRSVETILHAACSHLGMDIAFISEFRDKVRVFHHVDAESGRSPLRVGNLSPLIEGYCRCIIDGVLPELIADTSKVPAAMALPETHAIAIADRWPVDVSDEDGGYGWDRTTDLGIMSATL